MINYEVANQFSPISESFGAEIIDIVSRNVTSLSLTSAPADHPAYEAYRRAISLEVGAYLGSPPPHPTDVVTASIGGRIVGFLLCTLPMNGDRDECSISYIAVEKKYRKNGLMRAMLSNIKDRYAGISLSCEVGLVPMYEKLGFKCVGLFEHQIIMYIGEPAKEVSKVFTGNIMEHPSVLVELNKAKQAHSAYAIEKADRAMKKTMAKAKEHAKRFLASKI